MCKSRTAACHSKLSATMCSQPSPRSQVLAANGDERIRRWFVQHLLEPRLDAPSALMPNVGLSKEEAEIAADYLMQPRNGPQGFNKWFRESFGYSRRSLFATGKAPVARTTDQPSSTAGHSEEVIRSSVHSFFSKKVTLATKP
jgi:hypothetical protein